MLNCSCGRPRTSVHFYFCKRNRQTTPPHLRRHMEKDSIGFLL
ncbi:hypothetical protein CCHL11_07532 [Colletotrichum chlorophyti]|uniref:Uncharacterized protein n=1 Tax=Colletotrichum chlorophyti TaxID=708187 RepID=A0A1Q8S479_9PEZI|nr:hypothetical protein CCHL11_07532 [Colletotrichum chlorophyti]